MQTLDQSEKWFQEKKHSNMPVVVAECEKKIVGFGSFGIFCPNEAYKYCIDLSVIRKT